MELELRTLEACDIDGAPERDFPGLSEPRVLLAGFAGFLTAAISFRFVFPSSLFPLFFFSLPPLFPLVAMSLSAPKLLPDPDLPELLVGLPH